MDCPCGRTGPKGRPLAYEQCCGPYITDYDEKPAPDAEALMRSRYTASVLRDYVYLLETWDASTRPPSIEFDPDARWLGLEVRDHRVVDDTHAEVEFVARYRVRGRGMRLHERSRFVRGEGGRWVYVDGVIR